ncbi:Nramp family divalent metal transporter [Flavihumibacter petaseus]|uniref:Divalent metal cation transporter MntH n=1 Tax=Flavihumibacter petaseus NBRC 106054 TaxID=1220578 RepID=A0A0E9N0S7_9BACT|nr:Nramp family divalent metal transporter [Flavihumibacter petaseus]GAO43617.1 manganese transporter MntH [Flavihumibacter petaseus NBRC 106054]
MMQSQQHDVSLSEVHNSVDTTNRAGFWKKLLSFLGPAYLVSVGYMDPGNWATDLQGGSQFGYSLLWVLLMSNLMALLLQSLSARLGIVRGRDLAQANRETFPAGINFLLYLLAEIAIAATDLAEVLGMAIGIHLLTGLPLMAGVAITVADTFLLLWLQKLGMRKMELFIIGLISIISVSFLIEIILVKPVLGEVVTGLVPTIPNNTALYIAIGIIGATVMPHNLYLHSALVQTRKIRNNDSGKRRAIRMNVIDSTIALNLAFFVNAAILILAATAFHKTGQTDVARIEDAHRLLDNLLGTKLAPALFAIALIAAGQSSTVTGTLAGQIVMEGHLRLRINPWLRRLLTRLLAIVPALIVIYLYGDSEVDSMLVLSQVILSMQLGFAVIPLIHFVSDKEKMGNFHIKPLVAVAAWAVAAILVYLNLRMVLTEAYGFLTSDHSIIVKGLIVAGLLLLIGLLLIVTLFPFFRKRKSPVRVAIHEDLRNLEIKPLPVYSKVAIALEFSQHDSKLIAHAMAQASPGATLVLIHVVESVTAKFYGSSSEDLESQQDSKQLEVYVSQLEGRGYKAIARLGHQARKAEIVRITNEESAELLIMGAHRHKGMEDILYGDTINKVRHELRIPVLVVNL